MRIGIITNTDTFIPFAYTLVSQGLQVYIFFSPSPDDYVNQKIRAFSSSLNIPLLEEQNTDDLYSWILKGSFDVCFMLGYKHLIKLDRLKALQLKFYNIHFGILPEFRGPVPVFWQLKSGNEKIGLTIHTITNKFDDGDIVWLKETPNLPHYNYELVNQLFGQLCVEGVFYVLQNIINKITLPIINRTNNIKSYQKRPGIKDVTINWEQMTAVEICDLIKACNPWNKGAATLLLGQELKLMDAQIIADSYNIGLPPGTIVNEQKCLHVLCFDHKVINVNMLYYNNSYLATYHTKTINLVTGNQLGK